MIFMLFRQPACQSEAPCPIRLSRCWGLSFRRGPAIRQRRHGWGHGHAVSGSPHGSEERQLGGGRRPHHRLAGRATGRLSQSQRQSIAGHRQRRAHAKRRHGGGLRGVRGAGLGPPAEGLCCHHSRG